MGEFGAVMVVAGTLLTLPLYIYEMDQSFNAIAAFSLATILAGLALVTLIIKTIVEWKVQR